MEKSINRLYSYSILGFPDPKVSFKTVTGEFPAQKASNSENASIWWRHHVVMVRWVVPLLCWYDCVSQEKKMIRTPLKTKLHVGVSVY